MLTRDEIENMPAGREMDVLIAKTFPIEGVFITQIGPSKNPNGDDWAWWHETLNEDGDGWKYEFKPSTDIAAAWEVAEKLRMTVEPVGVNDWSAHWGINSICVFAPTAPLAICRAALFAMMEATK